MKAVLNAPQEEFKGSTMFIVFTALVLIGFVGMIIFAFTL